MNNNLKSPVNIPVEKIRPFEGHPYKVLDNDEMNNLIDSIQQKGVISPIVVRPLENTDDEYEIISGHRRLRASVKAGLETVPALIYAVTRDEAAIMLVDSNLHREHILPSEKAFAYKLKLEALNHQGQTSRQLGEKWSVTQISEAANESERQIHRYIRLTHLIPELLEMMDEDKIALSVGVELSFLDEQMQYDLLRIIEEQECTPSYSQAWHMHRDFNEGTLTIESIENTLASEKPNQKPMCKVPIEKLQKIAPKVKDKDFDDFVLKACEHYYKYLQRQRSRDRDAR